MLTKKKMLAGLHELINVEEGLVTLYTNFSKVLMKHITGLESDTTNKINKLLTKLYQDTARHKELLDNLIMDVKGSLLNEY